MAGGGNERSNSFAWFGAVVVVLVVGTLGSLAFVVLRSGDDTPSPPRGSATATLSPTLVRDTTLRAAPSEEGREVARALAGTPVRLTGRLADGSWYVVEVEGRLDALGWVPSAAVRGVDDPSRVTVVAAPTPGEAAATSTLGPRTPDLPNLVFEGVYVRHNQLVAVIANEGHADLAAPVMVAVGSGAPRQVSVADKPLRPGDRLELPMEGEYVQRRALVRAVASTTAREETEADNVVEATVEPDQPNDLEVLSVTLSPELAATLRNNSPIPLVGTVSLTARETRPSNRLLTRLDDAPLSITAGGTQVFRFAGLTGLDLTRTQVLLQTSAINDANLTNDTYPR